VQQPAAFGQQPPTAAQPPFPQPPFPQPQPGQPPLGQPQLGQPPFPPPQPGQQPAGYPPAGYPPAGYPPAGYPPAGYPTGYPPAGGPLDPGNMAGQFAVLESPAPKRRRGLVIGIVVAALVVVAGGGGIGAFLLTRDTSKGQATPTAAVTGFFTAIYTDNNVTEASRFVCADSRDPAKLTTKINEIKAQDTKYNNPRYSWSNPESQPNGPDETIVTSTVTVATSNEQKASQNLRIVATRHNGWFVCEIQQTG
jgi:hypothetical protein